MNFQEKLKALESKKIYIYDVLKQQNNESQNVSTFYFFVLLHRRVFSIFEPYVSGFPFVNQHDQQNLCELTEIYFGSIRSIGLVRFFLPRVNMCACVNTTNHTYYDRNFPSFYPTWRKFSCALKKICLMFCRRRRNKDINNNT